MSMLLVLKGLPASGKTTYAKKLESKEYICLDDTICPEWKRINWDDERQARGLHNSKFDWAEEKRMQSDLYGQAEYWGTHGFSVVVDNTNLSQNTRNKWKGVAERAHMFYSEHAIDTPLDVCIGRDALREGRAFVGRAVIERMALFAGLVSFDSTKEYIVVDMDGTLADCSERRKFISEGRKDWENFESHSFQDEPIYPIIRLTQILKQAGFEILIVSGRHVDKTGKDTIKWLDKYNVPYNRIFMRRADDNRADDIIKQEILDKLPKDRIRYVLDDLNRVVDMWRRNGLTCLQVAPGDF